MQVQDAGCRMQVAGMRVAGRGLQVSVESRPHFLTNFSVDIVHGECLLVKL